MDSVCRNERYDHIKNDSEFLLKMQEAEPSGQWHVISSKRQQQIIVVEGFLGVHHLFSFNPDPPRLATACGVELK
jgi:hypothetical protein